MHNLIPRSLCFFFVDLMTNEFLSQKQQSFCAARRCCGRDSTRLDWMCTTSRESPARFRSLRYKCVHALRSKCADLRDGAAAALYWEQVEFWYYC